MIIPKSQKALGLAAIRLGSIRPRWSTKLAIAVYGKWGMQFEGDPNYISSSAWFDGADYSLITLCEGATISSRTSFLTHDWSVYNVGRALKLPVPEQSLIKPIRVGPYTFIGRGSLLMPGADIGEGAVIGAHSVVRGKIPPFSLVVGNPGEIIGDARDHFDRHATKLLGENYQAGD